MRRINNKKLAVTFLFGLFLLCCDVGISTNASAESQEVSISAVPSILDKGGAPGENVPFSVNITNDSQYVLPIHLASRPMLGMEGETDEFLQANNAQQWIKFDEPNFLLDAGKTKEIKGSLVIPREAGPEGYYADIIVKPLGMRGESGSVTTQPELTIRMLVRVSGEAIEKIEATKQGSSLVVTRRSTKQNLIFTLKNAGNVHELVRPVLHVTQRNRTVYTTAAEPMFVLPRETRQISFDLPSSVGGGMYEAKLLYDYGAPLKHGVSPSYRVVVMPFSPVIILLVPIGFGAYIIWKRRERLQRALRILVKGDKSGN